MDDIAKGQLNDNSVSILRLLKGTLVKMHSIGAELIKAQQSLGNGKFAKFVQTKLPLNLREAELLMALAATPELDATKFTPPIEVKLPRLLEVFGQIVGTWAEINDGTVPEHEAMPPENTTAQPQVTADMVIGTTVLCNDTTVRMSENASAVATVSVGTPTRRESTAEQRRFIGTRSVKLLMQVNRGELTADEAIRQAETMPIRRVR